MYDHINITNEDYKILKRIMNKCWRAHETGYHEQLDESEFHMIHAILRSTENLTVTFYKDRWSPFSAISIWQPPTYPGLPAERLCWFSIWCLKDVYPEAPPRGMWMHFWDSFKDYFLSDKNVRFLRHEGVQYPREIGIEDQWDVNVPCAYSDGEPTRFSS